MPDAEGNPVNEHEAKDILHSGVGMELWRAAATYVVPLFWSSQESTLLRNGTGFFLRIADRTLLITAAHVIRGWEQDRKEDPSVVAQVMDISFDPSKHLIDIDDELDVATIRVPDHLPAALGKWVYQRSFAGWPPPPPTIGRGVFFTGFPSLFRTKTGPDKLEYGLYGCLLTATSVSEINVVSQLDRRFIEPIEGLSMPPLNASLGGMSGAPGWSLTQIGWRLAGVLYEYSQDYELFYFRRPERIRPDGTLARGPAG